MNKFQKEIESLIERDFDKTSKELFNAYTKVLRDIKKAVANYLVKYEKLSYSKKLDLKRLISLQRQIEANVNSLVQNQKDIIFKHLRGVGQKSYNELFYDFEMSNQLRVNFTILSESVLNTIINTPVANLKLSERLKDGVVTELKANILSELVRGVGKGDSYQKIAARLAEVGESSYRRAVNITRTEGGRVSAVARQRSQNHASSLGIDFAKMWVSTLDGSTRDTHRELDGQKVASDCYFEIRGKQTLQPHMFGDPSEDCGCRCRSISVIKGYELTIRKDNETKKVIRYQNYKDWLTSRAT